MATQRKALGIATATLIATPLLALNAAQAAPNTPLAAEVAPVAEAPRDGIEGSYIVYLKTNRNSQSASKIGQNATNAAQRARAAGVKVQEVFAHLGAYHAKLSPAQLAELRKDREVELITQDQMVGLAPYTLDADQNYTAAVGSWGLDRIDQKDLPLDSSYTAPNSGAGTHAYVIDTGVRQHAEFGSRLKVGYDAYDGDNDADDCGGHGTHVAGTIAGSTTGVANQASVYPVRVLGCDGRGSTTSIVRGMDWVAQNASKPAVANLSLGGGRSPAMDQGVKRLVQAGITTVVAAGNGSSDACGTSPGRAPEALTVASSTSRDGFSSFSNYGSCVDIIAPGSQIRSAKMNGGFTSLSGTSMAAPHVAGAAALYLATNTSATPNQVSNALVGGAVSNKIQSARGTVNKLLNVSFIGGSKPTPTGDPTGTPTSTPTSTATGTPTSTVTDKPTPTPTWNPTPTSTATGTPTSTATGTPTSTATGTPTSTATGTPTATATSTPTPTDVKPNPNKFVNVERRFIGNFSGVATNIKSTHKNARAVKVKISMYHTCANHLRVDLQSPSGRVNTLKRARYAYGSACDRWAGVRSASYKMGTRSHGNWQLRAYDMYGGETGQLNGWSITFD